MIGRARVQTVDHADQPELRDVLAAFAAQTGCAVLATAPFAPRGEPVVCTPDDAYQGFMRTGMDALALGHALLLKAEQPPLPELDRDAGEGARPDEDDVEAFARALDAAFFDDFLPATRGLGMRAVAGRGPVASTWTAVRDPAPGKAAFSLPVPEAADGSPPDPRRLVEAISASWAPGPATDALRESLVEVLGIARGLSGPP